jgi:hypothetical protein
LRSPHLRDIGNLYDQRNGHNDEVGGGEQPGVRYCTMYDEGYTSLGGVNDTVRNPKLRAVGEDGRERYRPAWEMTWDQGERLGRE